MENAIFESSLFRIAWQDLMPNEDTNLADAVTTVALTNETDTESTLVLRLVGDHGTTKTDISEAQLVCFGVAGTGLWPRRGIRGRGGRLERRPLRRHGR